MATSTKKDFKYYVTNLDWGDGTSLEYVDSPQQFDRIDNFKHTYVMPGFYSITGLVYKKALNMVNLFPDPVKDATLFWKVVETSINRESHDGYLDGNNTVKQLLTKDNKLEYLQGIGIDANKIQYENSVLGDGYAIEEIYNSYTNITSSNILGEIDDRSDTIEVHMSGKNRGDNLTNYTQSKAQGARMSINIFMDPIENNYMDYSLEAWLPNFGRIEIIPESEAPSGDDFYPPDWSPPTAKRALQLHPIPGFINDDGGVVVTLGEIFESYYYPHINNIGQFLDHVGDNNSVGSYSTGLWNPNIGWDNGIWRIQYDLTLYNLSQNMPNPIPAEDVEILFFPNNFNSQFSEIERPAPNQAPDGWTPEAQSLPPSTPLWVEYQSPVPDFPEGRGQLSAPPNFLWPPSVITANSPNYADIEPRDINEGGQQFFGWNGRNQPIDEGGLLDIFGKYELDPETNEKIGKGYLANELHNYFLGLGVTGINMSFIIPDFDKPNSDQIQHNGVTAGVGLWKLNYYGVTLFDGTNSIYDNYDPYCDWIINEDSDLWNQAIGTTSDALDGRNDGGRWIWSAEVNENNEVIPDNYEWVLNPNRIPVNEDGEPNPIDELSEDEQWVWNGEEWVQNINYIFDELNPEPNNFISDDNQWIYMAGEGWIRNDYSVDNPTGWQDTNPIGEYSSDGQWIWNGTDWYKDETFDHEVPNPEFNPTRYKVQVIAEKATKNYEPIPDIEADADGRYLYSTDYINGTDNWQLIKGNFYTKHYVRRLYFDVAQVNKDKDTYSLEHGDDPAATDIWKFYLKNIEMRFQNTEDIEYPLEWERFKSNIVVNSSPDYKSPFFEKNRFLMIGGMTKKSYYYKTLATILGYDYKTGDKKPGFSYDEYNQHDIILALDTMAKFDKNNYDNYLNPYTKMIKAGGNMINKGMVVRRWHGVFKNTNLTDTDIGSAKIDTGVRPMWKHLGLANDEFDIPNRSIYWKNIIPKGFDLSNREGITQRDLPDPMKGSLTPRIPRKEFIVDEEATQYWKDGYYWPVLPKFNKYGGFSDEYPPGSENQRYGDEKASITNLNFSDDKSSFNLSFDNGELTDKNDIYRLELNVDFSLKLDSNNRIVKNKIDFFDSIELDEIKQAF